MCNISVEIRFDYSVIMLHHDTNNCRKFRSFRGTWVFTAKATFRQNLSFFSCTRHSCQSALVTPRADIHRHYTHSRARSICLHYKTTTLVSLRALRIHKAYRCSLWNYSKDPGRKNRGAKQQKTNYDSTRHVKHNLPFCFIYKSYFLLLFRSKEYNRILTAMD